jgi:hypothetical protein
MLPPPNGHQHFAQDEVEFSALLDIMKDSMSILEIGSRYGESFRRFAKAINPRSRVVSVDFGRCVDSQGFHSGPWLYKVCGDLSEEGYDVHLILRDSQEPETVRQVEKLGPFDFVFIDGDHSEKGVNLDWINYGPMGKVVAFHDTTIPCIKTLWDSIPKKKQLIWNANAGPGIGVIYNAG